jgi:hypothetical protein
MKKINLYVLVLLSLFFSCQSDEAENEKIAPTLKLEFTYDGVLYSSAYHYSSDSIVIVDDEEVSEVYNKLMGNEQLATVVGEDGEIVYYDDYKYVEESLPQLLTTKSYISASISLSLYLYEHAGYTGSFFRYDNENSFIHVPSMGNPCMICKPFNLDNEITSIIANFSYMEGFGLSGAITPRPSGAALTIFEHGNYGGKSLTFRSRFISSGRGSLKINCLRDYKMKSGGLFSKSVSWNDQMSSVKLNLI